MRRGDKFIKRAMIEQDRKVATNSADTVNIAKLVGSKFGQDPVVVMV